MDILRDLGRRFPNILVGVLAGLVAAIVTTLAMVLSRAWLGISPPPEALPDRVAPLLSIDTFFSMFGTYGGYNGLKQFGIMSGLRGILLVGLLVGVAYALVIESGPSRRSPRWWLGASRPAWGFMIGAVLIVWVGFVIALWPVLPANYIGIPHSTARFVSIMALLSWWVLFAATLMLVYRATTTRLVQSRQADAVSVESSESAPTQGAAASLATPMSRRGVLFAALGGALLVPIHGRLREMYDDATFFYDGLVYSGEDIQPIAPNDRFYAVTKNVIDPDIDRGRWRLEFRGAIDNHLTLSFDDLERYERVDQETTLCCISNRIGAGLISNAMWRGVRLRDVLESAGVQDDAVEVKVWGADAYVDTFSMDHALKDTTLIVHAMNDEPLPRMHGGPVRIIVPGLYGEKNVKWVSRIEVVTSDAQGFYEQQGWGPNFVPPTRSDIFAPRTNGAGQTATFRQPIAAGTMVEIRGRAYSGEKGIRSVEVTTDGGETWTAARLYYPGTALTWALWSHPWMPMEAGEYRVYSRAVDGDGDPQPSEPRGIVPQGAQGYNIVTATVVA